MLLLTFLYRGVSGSCYQCLSASRMNGLTHCDRFPKTHYFRNKVTWLLFYLSKARLKFLAPILTWKCTPILRNFIQVHAQKYFFYRRSENGVYNSPALRESTTPVTSKPPVSMATGFPPTDGNSPIYGINSYFVSMVTGFAWLRQNLFTDIYEKCGNKRVIEQVKAHMTFLFHETCYY